MTAQVLKLILYYLLFIWFSACGGSSSSSGGGPSNVDCESSPNDPSCIEEQQREAEEEQTKAQEQAKFQSIGACLQAKKESAGVSKPTAEMLQQCKSS